MTFAAIVGGKQRKQHEWDTRRDIMLATNKPHHEQSAWSVSDGRTDGRSDRWTNLCPSAVSRRTASLPLDSTKTNQPTNHTTVLLP